jgi:hypothetical protein
MLAIHQPDLTFLQQAPQSLKSRLMGLFSAKHQLVVGSWQTAWMSIAGLGIELENACREEGAPHFVEPCMKAMFPATGELREMMKAFVYTQDPRYTDIIKGKISPAQICGAVAAWQSSQQRLELELLVPYDISTEVEDLSFDSLGGNDVLPVMPTTAGITGENTIKALLDYLGIEYTPQWQQAFMCDFGEMKRPDFKVGTVKCKGDPRLSNGFYIESTTRLSENHKDVQLFYLLHQIAQYADLPTIVVYDGPALSDRAWAWAKAFEKKHERDNRLFAVVTYQQFREWMLRKIGSQTK